MSTNAPEIAPEETAAFESARQAVSTLKKTFEHWIVIGSAVVQARAIATRLKGRKTFMHIIEQQGLGSIVNKSTASRLERIMAELPAVTAWRETLDERQKFAWAAPTAIFKHCPVFKFLPYRTVSPMAQLKKEKEELLQTNIALQETIHRLEAGAGRQRWTDPDEIAYDLIHSLTPQTAEQVAHQILKLLKARERIENPRNKADMVARVIRDQINLQRRKENRQPL